MSEELPMDLRLPKGPVFYIHKSDHLMLRVNPCLDPKGNDTARLCMSDIEIADYGKLRIIDHLPQDLLIFLIVNFIHRLSHQDS